MRNALRIKVLASAALLTLMLLWGGGGRNGQLMADASGCTRYDNEKPTALGCIDKPGAVCYYCEYSSSGGYSVCYEDETGTTSFCTDYQDIPPFDF